MHDSLVAPAARRAAWVDAASGGARRGRAAATRPLDVIKTRQMAARRGVEGGLVLTGTAILREEGARALFLDPPLSVASAALPLWADRGGVCFDSPGAYAALPSVRNARRVLVTRVLDRGTRALFPG